MSAEIGLETTGYGRSTRGKVAGVDVMGPRSREAYMDMFDRLKSAAADPVFSADEGRQNFRQSLMDGNTVQQTALSQLHPGQDFSPKATVTVANQVDGTKGNASTAKAANLVAGGQGVLQEQRGQVLAQAQKDHRTASAALMETAKDMGFDQGAVAFQMLPQASPGKLQAAATVGADLALTGAGSFVTAGLNGGGLLFELGKHDKLLSPKEQESLLKETLERLQSPSQPQDTRQSAGRAAMESLASADSTKPDFGNMDVKGLEAFLATPPEEQPEIAAIDAELHDFNEAQLHNDSVAAKNGAQSARTDLPDSGNITLAGDSLAGVFGVKAEGSGLRAGAVVPALAREFDVAAFQRDAAPVRSLSA